MSTLIKLSVLMGGRRVGTLAQTPAGEVFFEYDPQWLAKGFAISPYFLPLSPGLKREQTLIFDGLFGAFDDSLPDGWGRLLTDRYFRAKGRAPETLTVLERLAFVGDRGAGALCYEPADSRGGGGEMAVDLGAVARQAERIVSGSPEEALPALRAAGGSSSGSRPKVFVAYNPVTNEMVSEGAATRPEFEHWIVKFRAKGDPDDSGEIEEAYAEMARSAGIVLPPTRLFETRVGRFFGARRFDVTGGTRLHTHTFGGMVHSHFQHPNRDYKEFLGVVFGVTRDFKQVEQAYRRAAFNVLAHNRDDHVKNHAFVASAAGEWSLSPAFDLTFSSGVNGQHNMTVAGSGMPGTRELLALASSAGLPEERGRQILAEVSSAVKRWPKFAMGTGVSKGSRDRIASALKQLATTTRGGGRG